MRLSRPPLHWRTAVLVAVPGLAVAACTAKPAPPAGPATESPQRTASPASSKPATASAAKPLAPLTNLPVASAADAKWQAVALDLAGPDPSGLGHADVIFEEAGAPARFIAVYQSRQATAGPVTGTQPTDGQVLAVLHPLIGYDGAAAPAFLTALGRAKVITDVGYASHPSAYSSGSQGLSTTTAAIRSAVRAGTPPPPLFRYRGASSGASTLAAAGVSRPTSVGVTIPGNATQHWTFDARSDRWQLASGGPRIQVANLIVQTVPYKAIGLHHGVQSARVIGTGRAQVFSGSVSGGAGTAATGTWSKPHFADVTTYLSSSGSPMAFQPGPTFIVLAPQGTQVSTSGG